MPISIDSLLSSLKPRQLEAIQHTQAPQLILAGTGTGKTTTITSKIAYMVEKENIALSQILALTFSKEAARNIRENSSDIFSIFTDSKGELAYWRRLKQREPHLVTICHDLKLNAIYWKTTHIAR